MILTRPITTESLEIKRLLNASREEIFDAWTNPNSVQQWMCPPGKTVSLVELDVRVGGSLRIHIDCDKQNYLASGQYVEIRYPEKLSFTWVSERTNFQETLVTIELFERGSQTELRLTHQLEPALLAIHQNGWPGILAHLAEFCQERVQVAA